MRALDLALRFEDCGAAAILYTDINRDGAMSGVNVDATVDLAFAVTTPVIASGGVSSLRDIGDLKEHEDSGIDGVIVYRDAASAVSFPAPPTSWSICADP